MMDKRYELSAQQSYNIIGIAIRSHAQVHPKAKEFRFERVTGTQLMYNAYVLRGKDIPSTQRFNLIRCVGSTEELADVLNGELQEGKLPREVRVIKVPARPRSRWQIYFTN